MWKNEAGSTCKRELTVFFPLQVLQEYVRLVEDVETRLNLATKYKCHDVVIDVSLSCMCEEGGQKPAFFP